MNKRKAKKILKTLIYDTYIHQYWSNGYSNHEIRQAIKYGVWHNRPKCYIDKFLAPATTTMYD